jgi:hypothetical protein
MCASFVVIPTRALSIRMCEGYRDVPLDNGTIQENRLGLERYRPAVNIFSRVPERCVCCLMSRCRCLAYVIFKSTYRFIYVTLDHSGLLGCDRLVGFVFPDVYKVLKKVEAKYRGR